MPDVTTSMRPLQCERSRAWISVGLDGALSELESFRLERHLGGCPSCRAFASEAAAATHVLRSAPLESPDTHVELPARIPGRRRAGAAMAGAAAAAGLAAALVLHPASPARSTTAGAGAPIARPAGLALISYDGTNLGVRQRLQRGRVESGDLVRGAFQLPTV